jgi:hypothetical protein
MKVFLLLFTMILIVENVFAEDLCNFKGVPFGTDKDQVLKQLDLGNGDWQRDKNRFFVSYYPISDRRADLVLQFDDNGKFFGFALYFKKYTANKIEYAVFQDLAFISSAFKNKYGEPTSSFDIKLSDLVFKEGAKIKNEWDDKKCVARTSIGHYDSEFFAQADVLESKLFSEFMSNRRAKKAAAAKKAIKDF